MKRIINEAFEWSVQKKRNKEGGIYFTVYIDPKLSENTWNYKENIKKYGAKWDGLLKTWYFIVSSDESTRNQQIEKFVKPCVEYLKSVEKGGNGLTADEQVNKILSMIDELMKMADNTVLTAEVNTAMDPKDLKEKLAQFKEELLSAFRNGNWKQMIEPLLRFKRAQGASYSFKNRILIWLQDPKATMVKAVGTWNNLNRIVPPDAPRILMFNVKGTPMYRTPEEKRIAEIQWLLDNKKIVNPLISLPELKSVKAKLTIGEKSKMNKYVNQLDQNKPMRFSLEPLWVDVRFTEQMEGTEDLIGDPDTDIKWHDDVSEVTPQTEKLYNAMLNVIKQSNVKLEFVDDLQGSRGVSMNGTIQVLKDDKHNAGAVSTLVHEFSHELLHQTYLKNSDSDLGKYFIGKEQGRDAIEQQAEISAWIVMRNFGLSMQTAVNYVGCWGGDEENCVKVFDTVANVASEIIELIENQLRTMKNESVINEGYQRLTGLDVAKMLGPEAEQLYTKEKQKQISSVSESFKSMLNRINESPISKSTRFEDR